MVFVVWTEPSLSFHNLDYFKCMFELILFSLCVPISRDSTDKSADFSLSSLCLYA